ncbi:histone acetyltransferase KAT6B-like [Solanum tuberosum]|uniref:Uncharacterized protein n=1 Tax=Solanum tuberosum TaxID=4113 RepID=M1CDE1_SOLTU|nr:PREDICTED: histone acetyltransferase KAT6B-like [Solanum tuberosum]
MALSSFVPALSSPPPCTVAMLNRSGSLSSTSSSSSSPSCSVLLTCSFSRPPHTVAFMPFLRPTSLCYSRRSSQIVRMAPEEEKKTQRSPLDFPIEWERPKPGRRPDIFPQFSPMKTPLPPPMPGDPPEEEEEEEEKKEEEGDEEEEKEKEEEKDPEKDNPIKPEQ